MNVKDPKPPKLATRLFFTYCSPELQEEIHGDMVERFRDHIKEFGLRRAKQKYWLNVLKFFRWHTLKRRKSKQYSKNNIAMFKNYFKIAWRNALKHKAYSTINLSGLAVGLTSFILIVIYVQHQLSYDQFHENKDRIFRVVDGEFAITPNIVGPILARNFTEEIEHSVRTIIMGSQIFNLEGESFTDNVFHADPEFFDMFTFEMLYGTKEAIKNPNSLVISRKEAVKRFGREDVLNETLKMSGRNYTITGVLADIPENSMLQFDYVAPFYDLQWARREHWSNTSYHTFLQLSNGVDEGEFRIKIEDLLNADLENEEDERQSFFLQAFPSIYLQSDMRLGYEIGRTGDIKYVYIFMAVAVLILLIACINYVNLSTSRSLERAKEVGIRKVVGAYRKQLVFQFLGESFLFVFGSLAVSIGVSYLMIPYFNQLAGVQLDKSFLLTMDLLLTLGLLGLVISLLAGFYPAIMLSTFKPVAVLKGNFKNSGAGSRLRKVLVVFQFSISAFLLVATLVVNKQLSYIQNKNLGYDREQVLFFRVNGEVKSNFQTIKNELLANPNIEAVSMTSNTPINVGSAHGIKTGPTDEDYELLYYITADEDFIDLMDMKVLAGVDFKERAVPFVELDSIERVPSIILNETAIGLFGWTPQEAIGKMVTVSGYEAPVQAVLEDFHFKSMQNEIEPFVILFNPQRYYFGLIKLKTDQAKETIEFLESKMRELAPSLPLEYRFLDDHFDSMYRFESRLKDVFLTFASIAIVIACLGMFGLISFMSLNRAKEIGIRKVLGASVPNIIVLLSSDFLKLVSIALIISLPLAYYFMSDWLMDYAYSIQVGVDVLVISVISALLITCMTIGYQAFKTAVINPAGILRNE